MCCSVKPLAKQSLHLLTCIIVADIGRKRSGLIRLVISLECFIEIPPDFLCPFMND